MDYPELISNSDSLMELNEDDDKISGKVTLKKQSFAEKAIRFLIDDDVGDLKTYILKKTGSFVMGLVGESLNRVGDFLVGDSIRSGRRHRRDDDYDDYVSYDRYYRNKRRDNDDRPRMRTHSRMDFDEYGFDRRRDAQIALEKMRARIRDRGKCTVAYYYNVCTNGDRVGDYTDGYFGWRDLSNVSISMHRDQFYIDLPQPKEFD